MSLRQHGAGLMCLAAATGGTSLHLSDRVVKEHRAPHVKAVQRERLDGVPLVAARARPPLGIRAAVLPGQDKIEERALAPSAARETLGPQQHLNGTPLGLQRAPLGGKGQEQF